MKPTKSLLYIAISHRERPELAIIMRVVTDLMEGRKPSDSDMKDVALCYMREPIMCTLDYQDLCDFIESKFGE